MRAAIVVDNKVVNVIEVKSLDSFIPQEGTLVQDDGTASIGGKFVDGVFYAYQPTDEEQSESRRKAYQLEADPLFFKAQRGEATLQQWQDKVAEIKARFPKE